MDFLKLIFDGSVFEPHRAHFFDTPIAMDLSVYGNAFSFLAYLLIPVVIIYFVRKRRDLYLNWMVLLFGAFIFLCGLTHLMHVLIFWYPAYYLQAIISVVTFLVSAATAVAMLYFLPIIVSLVSPEQMQQANKSLSDEIKSRESKLGELAVKKEELKKASENLILKNEELENFNRIMANRDSAVKELEAQLVDIDNKHA
ncbi:MAG: hypothetical protein HYS87_00865 [Candidatus Colwellbacteria bacterium]|nr:hypothetical protein [Candidatus Colwellbacteria bacterium]